MILLQILLSAQLAHAGNGHVIGNGGNTIACTNAGLPTSVFVNHVAVLDVAEGHFFGPYTYKKLSSYRGQSLQQAFPAAVKAFLGYSKWQSYQLLSRFSRFSQQTKFVPELPRISGSSTLSWSAPSLQCEVQQAAIQYGSATPNAEEQLILQLSSPIWNKLETDQKIALLFHEYLLKDRLLAEGGCTLRDIRDRVGFILSDQARAMTPRAWTEHLSPGCEQVSSGD